MNLACDDKLDISIKDEVSTYADGCMALFKQHINIGIETAYNKIANETQSKLKAMIVKVIEQKELFNYSDIKNTVNGPSVEEYINGFGRANSVLDEYKKKFIKFVPGEEVIMNYKYRKNNTNRYINIVLTNYARCIGYSDQVPNIYDPFYEELNFWIPVPYIKIIFGMLSYDARHCKPTETCTHYVCHETIIAVLKLIKNDLHEKIVPTYVGDIIKNVKWDYLDAERKKLAAAAEYIAAERAKLEADKAAFMAEKIIGMEVKKGAR